MPAPASAFLSHLALPAAKTPLILAPGVQAVASRLGNLAQQWQAPINNIGNSEGREVAGHDQQLRLSRSNSSSPEVATPSQSVPLSNSSPSSASSFPLASQGGISVRNFRACSTLSQCPPTAPWTSLNEAFRGPLFSWSMQPLRRFHTGSAAARGRSGGKRFHQDAYASDMTSTESLRQLMQGATNVQELEDHVRAFRRAGGQLNASLITEALSQLTRVSGHGHYYTAAYLTELMSTCTTYEHRFLIDTLDPEQQICALYAWAKIGHCPDPEFLQILESFMADMDHQPPSLMAQAAWAVGHSAQARALPPDMTKPVVERTMRTLQQACTRAMDDLSSQDLANLMLGASYTGVLDPAFVTALPGHMAYLAAHTPEEGGGLSARHLSMIMWALARLRCEDDALIASVAAATANAITQHNCMEDARPQDWANLLWALAALRYYSPDIFGAAEVGCRELMSSFAPREVATVFVAFAAVNHVEGLESLMDDMVPILTHGTQALDMSVVCNMMWAIAVVGVSGKVLPIVHAMKERVLELREMGRFHPAYLCQLWQANLELVDQGLGFMGLEGPILEEARLAWMDRMTGEDDADPFVKAGSSGTIGKGAKAKAPGAAAAAEPEEPEAAPVKRRSMPAVLKSWGYGEVQEDVPTPDHNFVIDALMKLPDNRFVGVEFDGPSHFLRHPDNRYDGATELRNRQLERLQQRGLDALVLVGYHEWDQLDEKRQLELLQKKVLQEINPPMHR